MTAGQNETITTKDIQLDGKLAAGNNLTITTDNDITNDSAKENYGITQADGNMTISAKGNLTNSKKLEAKGTLTLHAKDISNKESGEINGGSVSITSTTLTNRGLVSADQANTITTDILQNIATGRIYGEDITLHAKTLENRKDKVLEEKLSAAMKDLKQKEKDLDDAFAIDVTAFKSDSEKENYFKEIENKQAAYATSKAAVDAILADMAQVKSATIAARNDMIITGDALLNSASSLLYAGGDMSISEAKDITNRGADIKAQGNLSLTAPTITNENEAFSAKRVWTSEVTNPDLIRIDEKEHPEKGQSFSRDEFSALDSGYGAYHNKGITPKTLYEEAGYDKIEQITEEERKEGEKPVPDDLVGKEAPNYDYNDPIFKELGVKSMDTPRPGYDDPKQADWDKQYKEILNQLNEKIKAYNEEAKAYNDSIGAIESKAIKYYTIIRTTTHTSEKQVQETKAGTISSGKDMTLTGNVTNENSRITAGSTLTATGGTLNNVAEKNQVQKITFGTTQESYTKRKHRPHKAWRRHYRDEIFMTPQKELDNPTSLDVGSYEGNTGKNPNKEDITQTMRDNVQQNLNPFATGKETNPGSTAGKETGGTLSFIPDSSLYKLHPEEKAKYLIETDPAFTNKKTFLSSDYMYNQLLWDNDKVNKRLGDGFYEQELIRNQVTQLTGMRYLNGYTNDEEEYKALMDAGIAYAKEYNLKPGISLTKEQMTALTSDIVWLETTTVTVNGKTYDVLYPHVYLKAGSEKKIAADGSLISANQLVMEAKNQLANSGALMGNAILMQGKDIVNRGMIYGDTVQLKASHDIKENGIIHAEKQVSLTADHDITMQDTVLHEKNQDVLHTTAGIAVKGKDGVLLMEAGKDIHLTGATLEALGDNGTLILKAGNNIHLDTDTLEAKKDMTENSDNYIRTYRKTETTNTLAAGKNITLVAGENLSARNTTVLSENGQITVAAKGDVNLENGYNESRDDYGLKYKERGLLSSKTTTIKSHDESKTVTASTLSGDTVQITAGGNTNMTGSQVIGTHDVAISSGEDTSISSAEEYERHDYAKQVKKSGLLSGGGLGFTIGTEKRKDQYSDADILQKASTVGSTSGNVSIESGNKVEIGASAVLARKDISITGENVQISSKDNVYHSEEKHEYKKSGLTVSATGGAVAVLSDALAYAQKASSARDKQLKALYGAEVYQTIAKGKDVLKDLSGKGMPGVSVGIGTSSFKAETHTETIEAVGSNLLANNDIHITAKKDIEMKGSQIIGNNVSMNAGENITLNAAENRSTSDTKQSSKSSQAGMSFAPTGNSFYANASKGQGNETEGIFTHTSSQVIARKNLTTESGKDTTLRGSNAYGDKVTIKAGGNLAIESVQDKDSYTSHNESKGMGLSIGSMKKTTDNNKMKSSLKGGLAVGTSKSNIDSTYESVTNQAGITAGSQGYDVSVKDTTHLKGGLIDSHASQDKNTLTTGTLVWEDIENKADYKATASGRNYGASWSPKETVGDKKVGGLTGGTSPVKSQPVKGKAESITKSAVSEGAITITDKEHQKQDISDLNRDTKNTLNKLEKIFDKEKVQERQALANEFAKLGAEKIGDIAKEKGWDKNDSRRTLLHGLLGGITAKLGGNNVLSGAMAGAGIESLQPLLDNFLKDHPDMREEVASIFGYATGKLFGGDGDVGSATAWSGTKFNWINHKDAQDYADKIKQAENAGNADEAEYYSKKRQLQDDYTNELLSDYEKIHPDVGKVDNNPFTLLGVDASGIPTFSPNIPLNVKKTLEDQARDKVNELMGKDYYDYKGMGAFDGWASVRNWGIAESAGLPWELVKDQQYAPSWAKALGKYSVIGSVANGTMNITQDFRDYSGKDRYLALGIDSVGLLGGVVVGTIPLGGGITTIGLSIAANRYIDSNVLKYKLQYTKTDKEKNNLEKLNRFQKEGDKL